MWNSALWYGIKSYQQKQALGNWFTLADCIRRSTWQGRHGSRTLRSLVICVCGQKGEYREKLDWLEPDYQAWNFIPSDSLLPSPNIPTSKGFTTFKMVPLTGREAYRTHEHEEHFTFKLQAWNSALSIFIRKVPNQNSPFIASMKNTNLFCQDTVEGPTSSQNISTSYQLMKL